MGKQEPRWYTDHHRRLAEAEAARMRWLIDTAQWPYEREPSRLDSIIASPWPKLVIAGLLLVLLVELMRG